MTNFVALLLLSASFGSEPLEVTANRLEGSQTTGVYRATGDVILKRPGLIAYADRMVFYEKQQLVEAEGNVVLVEDVTVTTCSKAKFTVPELIGGLAGVKLQIKKGIDHLQLRLLSKDQLRNAAKNDVTISARNVRKTETKKFNVSDGSFTPCHCEDEARPSWSISTSSASVDLNSGALLKWPVFHVKDVPVFALPLFYLPLGERRSGLLLPRAEHTSVTGWLIEQPLYLTLGRSWDATLGARHFFDRGFSPRLEMRWAPSRSSNGWLRLSTLFDDGEYDAESRTWSPTADASNFRFSLAALHRQHWGRHRLGVELNASGDPSYIGEFADQYLQRQTEYTSSRATYTYNDAANVRVAAGLNLLQDLRPQRYRGLPLAEVDLFSAQLGTEEQGGPGNVSYRYADLRVDALNTPLLQPWLGLYGEAVLRAQAFAAPWPVKPRFGRVDFRPQVMLPFAIGNLFSLDTNLAARLTSWSGRASSKNQSYSRWAVISKTSLSSEISGAFSSVIHRIQPRLSHVIIPKPGGEGPGVFENSDEIDLLGQAHQLSMELYTDVLAKKTGQRLYFVSGSIGRQLLKDDLQEVGWAPLNIKAGFAWSPFAKVRAKANGSGYWALEDFTLEELLVSGSIDFGQVLSLSTSWLQLGDEVSRRSFVAPEELIPSRTLSRSAYLSRTEYGEQLALGNLDVLPWEAYRGVMAAASLRPVPALTIAAGFTLDVDEVDSAMTDDSDPFWNRFKQSSAMLRWDSPCECWSASMVVTKARDRETPDVRFVIDLAHLGGVGY